MYCPHCGHLNPDGALYCTNCGMRLSDTNPANPAASNPEATASFPRVVPSPEATAEAAPIQAATVAEQPRRVVRSSRPRRWHGSQEHAAQQPAMHNPRGDQAPFAATTSAPAESMRDDQAGKTTVAAAGATRSVANDTTTVYRRAHDSGAPTSTVSTGQARVVQAQASGVPMAQPAPGSTTSQAAAQAYTVAPSPQQASPYAASTAPHAKRNTPVLIACIAATVLVVGLFATAAAGVGPFAAGATADQAQATASAPSNDEDSADASSDGTASSDSKTSAGAAASTAAGSTASQNSNTNGTNTTDASPANTAASDTSSATSSGSNSEGDVVDNGSGTVSSKTYGYSISMPSQFTQQSNNDSGATYYDASNDITISLWGDNNPNGTTVSSAYQSAKSSAGSGDYVAYGKNWVVYSTDSDSTGVVYDMTYYLNGKSCHMHISYPMSSKSVGDRIIEQVQPTFKLNS